MKQAHYWSISLVIGLVFLCNSICTAQSDSLVDCFPLAIGNQWFYRFNHSRSDDLDPGSYTITDTGTSCYTIVDKTVFPDSIVWTFALQRNFHRWSVYLVGPIDSIVLDSSITDSTTFALVELRAGRHELYRQSSEDPYYLLKFESGVLWNQIIPFQRSMPDSARMYRYHRVDSSLTTTFLLRYQSLSINLDVTLKKDCGISSLSVYSTAILWFESVHHQLVSQIISDVSSPLHGELPLGVSLSQNYPNPFNPITIIPFDLSTVAHVNLTIYTILGKEIVHLIDRHLLPGHYAIEFDGSQFASGVYLAKLSVDKLTLMRKMIIVR